MADADVPIACALPQDLIAARMSNFQEFFARHLVDWHRESMHLTLTLAVSATAEEATLALLAAEQECCSFLTLAAARQGEDLLVTVGVPSGADAALDGVADLALRVIPRDVRKSSVCDESA